MGGNKNSRKGSPKPRSSRTSSFAASSSQVQSPPSTISASFADLLPVPVLKLVPKTMGLNGIVSLNIEPAAACKLSEFQDNLALISSKHATRKVAIRQEKESVYRADPVFIPFPPFGVDYELGPTQELEDVLRDTVSKLSGAAEKASQLHTECENIRIKYVLQSTSEDLVSFTKWFEKRIEHVRQQREGRKAANVATPGSFDIERLMSAALDKVSSCVQRVEPLKTCGEATVGVNEFLRSVTRTLEKILLAFRRPNEGSQELGSWNVDSVRYQRKLERALDFSFFQMCMVTYKLIPLLKSNKPEQAREISEHFNNVAETLWTVREIVRRRESSVDELCRLMVGRSAIRTVKPAQRKGECVEAGDAFGPGGASSA